MNQKFGQGVFVVNFVKFHDISLYKYSVTILTLSTKTRPVVILSLVNYEFF